jgi:hypothetical protein
VRLLKLADAGDKDALRAVRQTFDADPALVDQFGDLAARVEEAVVRLIVGEHGHGLREAVVRQLAGIRAALETEAGSDLERLSVKRVGAAWLLAHAAQLHLVKCLRDPQVTEAARRAATHRAERASASLNAVLKAVGQLRQLLKPVKSPLELLNGSRGPRSGPGRSRQTAPGSKPAGTPGVG